MKNKNYKIIIVMIITLLLLTVAGCGISSSVDKDMEALSTIKYGDSIIKLNSTVGDTGLNLNVARSSNPNNVSDLTTEVLSSAKNLTVKNTYEWDTDTLYDNLIISLSGTNSTSKSINITEAVIESINIAKYNYEDESTKDIKPIILDKIVLNESSHDDVMKVLKKYTNVTLSDSENRISIIMFDGKDEFNSKKKIKAIFNFENDVLIEYSVEPYK